MRIAGRGDRPRLFSFFRFLSVGPTPLLHSLLLSVSSLSHVLSHFDHHDYPLPCHRRLHLSPPRLHRCPQHMSVVLRWWQHRIFVLQFFIRSLRCFNRDPNVGQRRGHRPWKCWQQMNGIVKDNFESMWVGLDLESGRHQVWNLCE